MSCWDLEYMTGYQDSRMPVGWHDICDWHRQIRLFSAVTLVLNLIIVNPPSAHRLCDLTIPPCHCHPAIILSYVSLARRRRVYHRNPREINAMASPRSKLRRLYPIDAAVWRHGVHVWVLASRVLAVLLCGRAHPGPRQSRALAASRARREVARNGVLVTMIAQEVTINGHDKASRQITRRNAA